MKRYFSFGFKGDIFFLFVKEIYGFHLDGMQISGNLNNGLLIVITTDADIFIKV